MQPTSDRLPPQNLEAERSVIGSAILENEQIDEVVDVFSAEDMYRDAHQILWRTIVRMRDAGQVIDVVTLTEALERTGDLERIGGDEIIESCIFAVPHAINARYYAKFIKEKSLKRKLIEACIEIMKAGYSSETEAVDVLCDAEEKILGISESQTKSTVKDASVLVAETIETINQRKEGHFLGIPTQFEALNTVTGGFHKSQVTILAARPGDGKSAMGLNFADHLVAREPQCAFFFDRNVWRRTHAADAICSRPRFQAKSSTTRGSYMVEADYKRLYAAARELESAKLYVEDRPSISTTEIAAVCRNIKRRNGLSLVIIDYLGDDRCQNQQGGISPSKWWLGSKRRIRTLSRELYVPILALHQLNRDIEKRGNQERRPRMSDLRESGQIEQDAHVIMFLSRPETYDKNAAEGGAELFIAKNRNGASGINIKLFFKKEFTQFCSVSNTQESPF